MEVLEWPTPKVSYSLSDAGREGRQALVLLDGSQQIAPAGEHLVRVRLMTDIPDQPVVRGVEHRMQRNREFHGAQTRRKVAAHCGSPYESDNGVIRPPPRQIGSRQGPQIGGRLDF